MTALDLGDALDLLTRGELAVEGRLVDASNATLYATATLEGVTVPCVYKPRAGERPLWDFPDGTLARREVAAYAVSEATGWGFVPPTVLREGPFGPGMCQLWVDPDDSVDLVDVVDPAAVPDRWLRVLDALGPGGRPVVLAHADEPVLRHLAVLDAVVNNADRKGGHILPTRDGRVHGIDHGVCFHVEDKLRTVLWGWAGRRLDDESRGVLERLATDLTDGQPLRHRLRELLSGAETRAVAARVALLLETGRHPLPGEGWPAIPWPPF